MSALDSGAAQADSGEAETDLAGLADEEAGNEFRLPPVNQAPVGAILPVDGLPRVRRTQFWPERTPVAGLTPVLPDEVVIALAAAAKAASNPKKRR
jgi:hypothetical protein